MLKILVITNFYPPARPGGYTQWCHEVSTGLETRGHQIFILTSNHELEKVIQPEKNIHRVLHLEGDLEYYKPMDFFKEWKGHQDENSRYVRKVILNSSPDLIFIWGMWAMSKSVPAVAESLLGSKVVYFLSDYWPAACDMHTEYWSKPARHWYMNIPKKIIGLIALRMLSNNWNVNLRFENTICVSAAVRDILVKAGLAFEGARIIHGGTDAERFEEVVVRDFSKRPLRLLYAGQLVNHKGVHTAIEAMSKLVINHGKERVHLTIVGSGHPKYEAYLRLLVNQNRLRDVVSFYGSVPKEEMPLVMRGADVLVFPSIYEEPFARMTQEAMIAGLVVVGTKTGGTKEILVEGENGLTFGAEDSDHLAFQLTRLLRDPDLCQRLSQAGRQTVLEKFTLDRMIDEIEDYLFEVAGRTRPNQLGNS